MVGLRLVAVHCVHKQKPPPAGGAGRGKPIGNVLKCSNDGAGVLAKPAQRVALYLADARLRDFEELGYLRDAHILKVIHRKDLLVALWHTLNAVGQKLHQFALAAAFHHRSARLVGNHLVQALHLVVGILEGPVKGDQTDRLDAGDHPIKLFLVQIQVLAQLVLGGGPAQ